MRYELRSSPVSKPPQTTRSDTMRRDTERLWASDAPPTLRPPPTAPSPRSPPHAPPLSLWRAAPRANSAPPLSVTDSAIAPSARILSYANFGITIEVILSKYSHHRILAGGGASVPCYYCWVFALTGARHWITSITRGVVTPKGVLRLALCNASATLEGS